MAKGSGLSFDSDRIGLFLHNPTVINSFPDEQEHKFFRHHHHHKLIKLETNLSSSSSMESSYVNNRSSPSNTIQFPVNLNCTHDGQVKTHDEMDFFAHDKKGGESVTAATTAADNTDAANRKELNFNVNTGLHLLTANTSSDQSIVDDGISSNPDDKRAKNELAVLQAELERINGENVRLKEMLNQVTNNYSSLQMHLLTLMQQKQQQQENNSNEEHDQKMEDKHGGTIVPRQFMDLGLAAGTAEVDEASLSTSEDRAGREQSRSPPINNVDAKEYSPGGIGREDSPDDKGWGPYKVSRLNPSSKSVEQATEATMRKARVSVRARSEAPMITDGCQWRKYGQKMAKGNPCPRAYYRCTMVAGCPVRKQVQRCAEDRTILITTYEGNHNHPLPPAAMAMASTTSSAAKMLLSGSMPSADHGLINSSNLLATTLFPSSSTMAATISASAPFPTVTLDLTQNPNPLNNFQTSPNNNNFHLPNPNNLPQIYTQALYKQSQFSGLQMSSSLQDNHASGSTQWTDALNAFTADPNFPALLLAALTSMLGGSHPNNNAAATNNATTSLNNGSTSNNSDTNFRES